MLILLKVNKSKVTKQEKVLPHTQQIGPISCLVKVINVARVDPNHRSSKTLLLKSGDKLNTTNN